MMYRILFLLIFLLQADESFSQKSHFNPGVFLSAKSLNNNVPDYGLEEVIIKEGRTKKRKVKVIPLLAFGPVSGDQFEDYLSTVVVKKITRIDSLGKKHSIKLEKVIAIANDAGIYFRVDELFVKAGVVGPLCHIPLQEINTAKYRAKAKFQTYQYLYKVKSGDLVSFDQENLEILIEDDEKLLDHFSQNINRGDQLYQYVLKYNERNKIN